MRNISFRRGATLARLLLLLVVILTAPLVLQGEEKPSGDGDASKKFQLTSLDLGLRINSVDRAVDAMTAYAERNGGYLVNLSGGQAVFRIPVEVGEQSIVKELLSLPGINLYSSSRESVNVTSQIVDLKIKLKVSQENLQKLRELSASAGLGDLLDLENALSESLSEVEQMKGEILYLEESSNLFTVRLNINASGVMSDPRNVPILWIRNLNLQSVVGGN
jgi:hypothetical protein